MRLHVECFLAVESGPLLARLLCEGALEFFGCSDSRPFYDDEKVSTPLLGSLTTA